MSHRLYQPDEPEEYCNNPDDEARDSQPPATEARLLPDLPDSDGPEDQTQHLREEKRDQQQAYQAEDE